MNDRKPCTECRFISKTKACGMAFIKDNSILNVSDHLNCEQFEPALALKREAPIDLNRRVQTAWWKMKRCPTLLKWNLAALILARNAKKKRRPIKKRRGK